MADIQLRWRVEGDAQARRSADRILGSFRDLKRETDAVQSTLNQLNNQRIRVRVDLSRAETQIANIDNRIQRLSNQRVRIPIDVQAARSQIDQLDTQIRELSDQRLAISIDDEGAEQVLIDIDSRLDRLQSRRTRLQLEFSDEAIEQRLRGIDTQIDGLQDRRVQLQVQTGDSRQRLEQLDDAIEQLSGPEAARNLRRLRNEISDLSNEAQQAERPLNRLDVAIGSFLGGLGTRAVEVFAAAIANVAQRTIEFVQSTVEAGVAARNADIAFTTILGSAEVAQATLQELSDFAATTPFDLPGIRQAGQQLLAFGFNTQELIPTLERVGNVAAGVGQPFDELAEIYGRARVQNRLFADDLNQLTGRGIPIIGELAEQFGVAESEIRGLVESGEVEFANLEQAFISLTAEGGQFFDLISAQSDTVGGQLSNLGDTFVQFQEQLFRAFEPALFDGLSVLSDAFEQAGQSSQALDIIADAAERFQVALEGNPEIATRLGEALATLADSGAEIVAVILDQISAAVSNPETVEAWAQGIEDTATAVAGLAQDISGIINGLTDFINLLDRIPGVRTSRLDFQVNNSALTEFDGPLSRLLGIAEEPIAIPIEVDSSGVENAASGLGDAIRAGLENIEEIDASNAVDEFEAARIEAEAAAAAAQQLQDAIRFANQNETNRDITRAQLERQLLADGVPEVEIRAQINEQQVRDESARLNELLAIERTRLSQIDPEDNNSEQQRTQALQRIGQLQVQIEENATAAVEARRAFEEAAEDARIEAIQQQATEQVNSVDRQAQSQQLFFDQQERSAQATATVFDVATSALEAQNRALQTRGQLLNAQSSLQGAIDDSEVQGLERALQIRQRLNSEEELSAQERRGLERELQALTGSRTASESRIQRQLIAAEEERSQNRIAALNAQQAVERQSLLVSQEQERIAAQRAVVESQIAEIQARASQSALQAEQARLQIQGQALRAELAQETDPQEQARLQNAIAQNELGQQAGSDALAASQQQIVLAEQSTALRQEELSNLAAIQERSQQQLALEQQLAQFQLLQSEAANARATATELAASASSSLTSSANANAAALERQRDAAEALAEALLRASNVDLSGNVTTLTPRKEGGPVSAGQSYLAGEAGIEMGIIGGKPMLFTGPTAFTSPASGQIFSAPETRQMLAVNPVISQGLGNSMVMAPSLMTPAALTPVIMPQNKMSTTAMESQLAEQTKLLQGMDKRERNRIRSEKVRRSLGR